VVVEVKNVIAMESIPIILELDDDMSMALVALGIDIPAIALVGELDMDMDILLISIDMAISWQVESRVEV
jgi:hypothetical protein